MTAPSSAARSATRGAIRSAGTSRILAASGVRVGAVRELPGLVQAAQAFADGGLPLPEAVGQQGPGVRVGLRELAGE